MRLTEDGKTMEEEGRDSALMLGLVMVWTVLVMLGLLALVLW